jgi:hypothetical protein
MWMGGRRRALTLALASALLVAAWQASADTCSARSTAPGCGITNGVTFASRTALFLNVAAAAQDQVSSPVSSPSARSDAPDARSNPIQSSGLLFLGVGLALIAKSLKHQKSLG